MANGVYLSPSTLHLMIDEVSEGKVDFSGRVSGICLEEVYSFDGMQNLMVLVDKLLNQIGRPQASREFRTWRRSARPVAKNPDNDEISGYTKEPICYHTPEEIMAESGKVATVNVVIETRKFSTWQGVAINCDGTSRQRFESEVQLLSLLMNVLK